MTEEVEMDDLSLADSIEAAFNEYDKPEESGRPEEDAKESIRAEEIETETEAVQPEPTPESEVDLPAEIGEREPKGEIKLKAPQSWKPLAREEWNKIPEAIREEVLRRENQITQTLQETAEVRKIGDELLKAAQPFMAMIEAENSTPVKAAQNMFQTAAMLKTGSPIQKATLLADIVKTYSIDIGLLDTALSSGIQSPQQFPSQNQAIAPQMPQDPRVDQLFSMIENAKKENQTRQAQASAKEVAAFSQSHEFFEDVREDMADLIEVSSRRGVSLSLEDAYNRAIAMHPEISQVITQRQNAQNAGASTARSRKAASSVKNNPVGGSAPVPSTLRGALEEAFNVAG